MTFFGLLLFLFVALVIAGLGEAWGHGHVPGGFATALFVGLIGAWVGTALFWRFGPHLLGIAILPTIFMSFLFVLILEGVYHRHAV